MRRGFRVSIHRSTVTARLGFPLSEGSNPSWTFSVGPPVNTSEVAFDCACLRSRHEFRL